jgi:pyruvate dehydrogenase E1 component alpha subunit
MAMIRRLDIEGAALAVRGVLPGYASARGQEAVAVGAVAALDLSRDAVFASPRSLGAAVATRSDAAAALAERSRAGSAPRDSDAHVAHAAGWALCARLDRTGAVAVALLDRGPGAASPETQEALSTALTANLPLVLVAREGAVSAWGGASSRPPHEIAVDGSDVLAVLRGTSTAIERARRGGGPVLVIVGDGRQADGSGLRDPLARCEQRLREIAGAPDSFFAGVTDIADTLAARVRAELVAGAMSRSSMLRRASVA